MAQQPPPPPPCAKGVGGTPDGHMGTWVMGTPVPPHARSANQQAYPGVAIERLPSYSGTTAQNASRENNNPYPHYGFASTGGASSSSPSYSSNPYIQVSPTPGSSGKSTTADTFFKVLGRCGKTLDASTRKAGGVAGNVWNHLKTSPNVTEAAMARLCQETKVFAEGGRDKIFQQTFGIYPGEQLLKSYACYISTSAGPVIGTLYLSTGRLAFCSDNPLCHSPSPGPQDWSYYKVVVRLDQLRLVNPSSNRTNPAEKYIQIVTADGHEFWFMGFVSYDKALKNLTEAFQHHSFHH